MTQSTHTKSLIFIFLVSLVVRTLAALPQHHPQSMDEAYSYINAVTLAQGGGFTENFIWNYLQPLDDVTHPGNLYWMPLTSIIAWVGLKIGGISYDAAQWGFILLSALLPVVGYGIAWQASGKKRYAWVVALMMLWSGFYFGMWTTIDNFTPFALAGSLTIYAAWRMVETQHLKWALIAGGFAGLAHLARADGPLLIIAIGLMLAALISIPKQLSAPPISWSLALKLFVILLVGYLVVMMPWFLRNIRLIGAPLAPGGSKTIWLQSYNDLFSYGKEISWRSYLAWGWGPILDSKLQALGQNLQRLLGEQGLIFALPLAIVGWWQLRRHLLFQLAFVFGSLLFIALTFVFTYPGVRGAWFHSGGALLPYIFTAAVAGLDAVVEAIARRRRTWRPQSAKVVFSGGLVLLAFILTLAVYVPSISPDSAANANYPEIVAQLADPAAIVMVGNPPAFLYYGGYKAIVIPNEPIDTTLAVADRYGAAYIAIDKDHPPPLEPLFTSQTSHPRLQLETTLSGPTYLYRILP